MKDTTALVAVSVLVVLATLVVPICSRLGREEEKPQGEAVEPGAAGELVLRRISDGVFADNGGRRYQVTEIKA